MSEYYMNNFDAILSLKNKKKKQNSRYQKTGNDAKPTASSGN